MIDELAHAGPEHLDPSFVAGYDRKQGHPDPAEDLDAFAAHGLDASSEVVDLAAGTGQFALAAARRFGHVTAVDVSPAMLEVLRERSAAAGLANLDSVRAGFLSYRHHGPPADGVYTRNALHQLPDFWKALALDRIARMLRPGGVLRLRDLIYDFGPSEAEPVFRHWFEHAAADPADGYTSGDYAEHIRTEFSTFRWLLEPMLARAGFQVVSVDFEGRLYGAYTCVMKPSSPLPFGPGCQVPSGGEREPQDQPADVGGRGRAAGDQPQHGQGQDRGDAGPDEQAQRAAAEDPGREPGQVQQRLPRRDRREFLTGDSGQRRGGRLRAGRERGVGEVGVGFRAAPRGAQLGVGGRGGGVPGQVTAVGPVGVGGGGDGPPGGADLLVGQVGAGRQAERPERVGDHRGAPGPKMSSRLAGDGQAGVTGS